MSAPSPTERLAKIQEERSLVRAEFADGLALYEVTMRPMPGRTVTVRARDPEGALAAAETDDADWLKTLRYHLRGGNFPPNTGTKDMAYRTLALVEAAIQASRPEEVRDVAEDEDFAVVGACESCRSWLVEGRDEGRSVDEDGVMLCTPCCAGAEAEPVDDPEATQVLPPPLLTDSLDGTGPALGDQ